jgi:hypothetical protein
VLRAPESESELRPHEWLKTARELAWLFTVEMRVVAATIP